MTNLNQNILEMIRNSEGHLTAEEVFLMAKKKKINVSMASIYRILNKLVDEGLIRKISISGKLDVFDKTLVDHEHLVCSKCGKIMDIHIKDLKKKLAKETGVEIDNYELIINYVCDDCKKKEKRKWRNLNV